MLARFIRDGRLVDVPGKRSKRLQVLDYLAQRFELGVVYSESEVNELIRPFHDDVAAWRRYLVDEDFMTRRASLYWRSGGTVEL